MLKISLSEGYVFDILSIIQVKLKKTDGDAKIALFTHYHELEKEIVEQIGILKFTDIIHSQEYSRLYNANLKVYELVDEVKKDNGLAKTVDNYNYQRYLAKQELQKSFFKNSVKEIKIGYNKLN